jgi:hypothetical protein
LNGRPPSAFSGRAGRWGMKAAPVSGSSRVVRMVIAMGANMATMAQRGNGE